MKDNANKRTIIIIYSLAFLLTYLLAFYPFYSDSRSFVLWFDGSDQTYPWLAYLGIWTRRIISNFQKGNFSIPLYDFSIGWGDGTINYLASNGMLDPVLAIASAMLPTAYVEFLYNALPGIYMYLAGLSFLHLCNYFKKEYIYSIIGAIIYVFNGFTTYYALAFSMAVNLMVFFPLLIVGAEKILRKQDAPMFPAVIFFCILCGSYYRLYILTALMGIYALVRLFDLYPHGKWIKMLPGILAKGIGLYMLGLGLAAPLLLPSLESFFSSTRTASSKLVLSSDFYIHWKTFWAKALGLIAPKKYYEWDWGLDYLSFAAVALISFILLFASKGKRTLKWLVCIGLFMLFCPLGGWIMNGFQYISNRWSFALSMLAGFTFADLMPEMLCMSKKQKTVCTVALLFYSLIACYSSAMREMVITAVGVAFFAVFILFFFVCKGWDVSDKSKQLICLLLVIVNVSTNIVYMSSPDGMNWRSWFNYIGTDTLNAAMAIEGECVSYPDGDDNYDGRFDSTSFHYNNSLLYGIPGTLFYTSTINGNISQFWKAMEMCGNIQEFKAYSTDQRTMLDTLLSVKYQIEQEGGTDYIPYGYKRTVNTLWGKAVYENEYALPWGYTYDKVLSYDTIDELNGVKKQEALMQAMAVEKENIKESEAEINYIEEKIPYTVECNNCAWENKSLICMQPDSKIVLHADLPAGKEYYIRIKGFNIDGYADQYYSTSLSASFDFGVRCGDVYKYSRAMSKEYPWYYGRENYMFCLGYSEKNRNEIVIDIPVTGLFLLDDIELFAMPMDKYPEWVGKLKEEPLKNIRISNDTLSGSVDFSKPKMLCVTIPYDKGWSAYVDGQRKNIFRANYAFIGLELDDGHHEIILKYMPVGLLEGMYLSVLCLCVLTSIQLWKKYKGKKLYERVAD